MLAESAPAPPQAWTGRGWHDKEGRRKPPDRMSIALSHCVVHRGCPPHRPEAVCGVHHLTQWMLGHRLARVVFAIMFLLSVVAPVHAPATIATLSSAGLACTVGSQVVPCQGPAPAHEKDGLCQTSVCSGSMAFIPLSDRAAGLRWAQKVDFPNGFETHLAGRVLAPDPLPPRPVTRS